MAVPNRWIILMCEQHGPVHAAHICSHADASLLPAQLHTPLFEQLFTRDDGRNWDAGPPLDGTGRHCTTIAVPGCNGHHTATRTRFTYSRAIALAHHFQTVASRGQTFLQKLRQAILRILWRVKLPFKRHGLPRRHLGQGLDNLRTFVPCGRSLYLLELTLLQQTLGVPTAAA